MILGTGRQWEDEKEPGLVKSIGWGKIKIKSVYTEKLTSAKEEVFQLTNKSGIRNGRV